MDIHGESQSLEEKKRDKQSLLETSKYLVICPSNFLWLTEYFKKVESKENQPYFLKSRYLNPKKSVLTS